MRNRAIIAHLILYVRDQEKSTRFYQDVLNLKPILHVPGMTEFQLSDGCILGLMPEAGIQRLLGDHFTKMGNGLRAELYLRVDDPQISHRNALEAGAKELSPLQKRDWGHFVAYSLDFDGNVLAFASQESN